MEYLFDHPANSNWQLNQEEREDGTFRILSGYGGYGGSKTPISSRPNIVFRARIRLASYSRGRSSVTFNFKDADDDHEYQSGPNSMEMIMLHIQAGNIQLVDGAFMGIYTFAKQGQEIYIMPYEERSNNHAR